MSAAGSMGPSPAWANPSVASSGVVPVEQHEEQLFSSYSTLDEPIMDTIMRDVHAVAAKLRVVMRPLDKAPVLTAAYSAVSQEQGHQDESQLTDSDREVLQQLKDWDLWGPLVLCLALGVILSFRAPKDQSSLVFASVFVAVWVGGTVVTINAQLLGGTISFFQSLCVMGYSIFPMVLAAAAILFIHIFINTWLWIDFIFVLVGFLWGSRLTTMFMSLYIRPERRLLALYPVFFFFTYLGWMILLF